MGLKDNLKESKNFIIYSMIAALIGTLIAMGMGGCSRSDEEVISSKRVKIELEETEGEEYGAEDVEAAEDEEETARALPVPAPTLAPSVAKKETVSPPPAPAVKTAMKEPVKSASKADSSQRVWALNVASFSKVVDALKLKDDLRASGYNAYVTQFDDGRKTWHRVRVGFYPSRDEAKKVADAISRKYTSVGEPWVVKPDSSEISAHNK